MESLKKAASQKNSLEKDLAPFAAELDNAKEELNKLQNRLTSVAAVRSIEIKKGL